MIDARSVFERVTALPAESGIDGATRQVLQALAWFADHGVNDPPQAWLAHWACVTRRHVVGVLSILETNSWIERHEGRAADGRVRRTAYVIVTDKLGEVPAPWATEVGSCRATSTNSKGQPCEFQSKCVRPASHGPCATGGTERTSISHGDERAYKERARAPARPSLSILPEFAIWEWPSEEIRSKAKQVLDVCGPGLADVASDTAKLADMFTSLEVGLTGTWAQFDFQRVVLTVVARKTARPRPQHKGLRNFSLLIENMIEEQNSLLARERSRIRHRTFASNGFSDRAKATKAMPAETSAMPSFNAQVEMVQRAVSRMERGEFGPFDIPSFERWAFHGSESERAEVCERALKLERDKLASMEALLSGLSTSTTRGSE